MFFKDFSQDSQRKIFLTTPQQQETPSKKLPF